MIEMTININITGLEGLAASIMALAGKTQPAAAETTAAEETQPAVTGPVPTEQNAAPTQPVSTSAVEYTLNDIANAAMTLMDSGRQPELLRLLENFGVDSLPALPQERYAEFATALRGLGARI